MNKCLMAAITLCWPKTLRPNTVEFEIQMISMQMELIRCYTKNMRPKAKERAANTLEFLHHKRRWLQGRR